MSDIAAAFHERCSQTKTGLILSVSERKRKLIVKNPDAKEIRQVKIDGCLPIVSTKCDYLFEVPVSRNAYYVELKGKDIKHALEQLLATMSYSFFAARHADYTKTCVVVSSQVPQMTPRIQRLKRKCKKEMKALLKIKTRRCEVVV